MHTPTSRRDSGLNTGLVVAVVGVKGAPGATASVLALALGWPRPVLVVDADLAGGDVATGWLAGRVGLDRGLLSFAAATRHADTARPVDLGSHVVAVPEAPGVMVLPGLAHAGQAAGLDNLLWARLVTAATSPWPTADPADDPAADPAADPTAGSVADPATGSAAGSAVAGGPGSERAGSGARPARVDVLADCGRIGPGTPWPLVAAAAVVLLATRPTLRGVHHARHALTSLDAALPGVLGDPGRVGLLVCGPGVYDPTEVADAVGLPVRLVLPADGRAADMLTDRAGPIGRRGAGSGCAAFARTVLARAARTAAVQLAAAADQTATDEAATEWAAAGEQPSGGARPGGDGAGRTGSARLWASRVRTGQSGRR